MHDELIEAGDGVAVDQVIRYLQALAEYEPAVTTLAERFAYLEGDISKVTGAFDEFQSNNFVAAKTLSDLSEAMGNLPSFQHFAEVMTNSASTTEQAQAAVKSLVEEYLNSSNALDMTTASNQALVKSMLEHIGVTNADEVATNRAIKSIINAASAAETREDAIASLCSAMDAEVAALGNEGDAAAWAQMKLEMLRIQEQLTSGQQVDTSGACASLSALSGNATGTRAALLALISVFQSLGSLDAEISAYAASADTAVDANAQRAEQRILRKIDERANFDIAGKLRQEYEKILAESKVDFSFAGGGAGGSGGGGGGSSKEVEEYIVDIDAYREAIKRLTEAQEEAAAVQNMIDHTDDLKAEILLQRELAEAYANQQAALHNLNDLRDETIRQDVDRLRSIGFEVEYDDALNKLWISNLEHLNELQAESQGEYDSLQEATNAYRKEIEDLIDATIELNDANTESSSDWMGLKDSIGAANDRIQSILHEIVEQASAAVDSIQNVYDTLHEAADQYAKTGYIFIDTLQSIIALGPEYTAYLKDENGQLVINEDRIRDVIAAKTEQLALETSLSYIEALRIAQEDNDIETLNRLLTATEAATDATWGLVYANLQLLDLSDDQYTAALGNINAIRALAENAIAHIGDTGTSVLDTLNEMKSGLEDILKYTMDMLKQRIQDQIDALEDMKDAYSEIIRKKKESLKADKESVSYQKTIAAKLKEMAQLQARIDSLSLDDSREAQRSKLLEELSDLQEELADTQSDHMADAQQEALDKMEDDYHKEKDREIEVLNETVSSYQKLYDMAISYISSHWDTLYGELIDWNAEYGSVVNSEITSAWDNCLAAAQRYGDYVSALSSIDADIAGASGSQSSLVGGSSGNYNTQTNSNAQTNSRMVRVMSNGQAPSGLAVGDLVVTGGGIYRITGVRSDGYNRVLVESASCKTQEELDAYFRRAYNDFLNGKYVFHQGGVVGGGNAGTLKQDEVFARLQKGELVLTQEMVEGLGRQMDQIQAIQKAFAGIPDYMGMLSRMDILKPVSSGTISNVTNNSRPSIRIGDTNIYGANQETVKKHREIADGLAEEIFGALNIRRSLYH